MTISPVAPAPSAPPAGGPAAGAASGLGALFAGLMGMLPQGSTDDAAEEQVDAAVEPLLDSDLPSCLEDLGEVVVEGEDGAIPEPSSAGAGLPLAGVPALTQPLQLTQATAAAQVTASTDSATGRGEVAGQAVPEVAGQIAGQAIVQAVAQDPMQPVDSVRAGDGAAADVAAGPTTTPVPETGTGAGEDRSTGQPARVESTSTTQPAGTAHATAGGNVAARADSPGPGGHLADHINGQVFGEVSRLVSRGDGTRRITLKLQPEALGDVRVVLTVRNGEVHVRMAGSELAQRALMHGAPELHRLLELAGAGSSQVVVGEQSSAQGSTHQERHAALETGQHHQKHHDHRNAGTRDGEAPARDGSPRGTQPRLSTDPAALNSGITRTRTAGVDVTI